MARNTKGVLKKRDDNFQRPGGEFKPAAIMAKTLQMGLASVNIARYIAAAEEKGQTLTPADVENRVRASVGMAGTPDNRIFTGNVVDITADEEFVRVRLLAEPRIDADSVPRFVNALGASGKAVSPYAAPVLHSLGFDNPVR